MFKNSLKLCFLEFWEWLLVLKKAAPGSLQNIWTRGAIFLLFWPPVHHGLWKGLFLGDLDWLVICGDLILQT